MIRRLAACVVCMVALAACEVPLVQPYLPSLHQPKIKDNAFYAGDRTRLPLRQWLPEDGSPQALIVALHGFNDYSNAFALPGQYLRRQGIAVFAYDQRGFGANDSHGIWAGEQNLTSDLKEILRVLKKKYPDVPLYVLGESMGGAVAIVAASQEDFPEVDGMILSAPAVWGSHTMNALYRSTLWLLAHTVPDKRLTGKDLKIQASDNIPMLIALGRDPLVIKQTRVDAIYGLVKLMDAAFLNVSNVDVPLLFLYGEKDQVIPRQPIEESIKRLKTPHVLVYYPEGYHMLLRDLKAESVLKDIAHWMYHPNVPLPSGYDRVPETAVTP